MFVLLGVGFISAAAMTTLVACSPIVVEMAEENGNTRINVNVREARVYTSVDVHYVNIEGTSVALLKPKDSEKFVSLYLRVSRESEARVISGYVKIGTTFPEIRRFGTITDGQLDLVDAGEVTRLTGELSAALTDWSGRCVGAAHQGRIGVSGVALDQSSRLEFVAVLEDGVQKGLRELEVWHQDVDRENGTP